MVISILLLRLLPFSVLLEATGRYSPYPIADNLLPSKCPTSTKYCTTFAALIVDNCQFDENLLFFTGTLSAFPSTRIRLSILKTES